MANKAAAFEQKIKDASPKVRKHLCTEVLTNSSKPEPARKPYKRGQPKGTKGLTNR